MLHTSCRFATASVLVAEIGSLPTVLLISKVGPGMAIQRGSKRGTSEIGDRRWSVASGYDQQFAMENHHAINR